MERPTLEVADIFRRDADAYRQMHRGLSSAQRRVMTAIETCRTAALGGHLEQCDGCGHERIAYNSCANRHCPTCQSLARAAWLERRTAELLDTEDFQVVFTVPAFIADLAFSNKRVVYRPLFRATADTLRTMAADPAHLGADFLDALQAAYDGHRATRRRGRDTGRAARLGGGACRPPTDRVGGVREAPVRRPGPGARLRRPVHASRSPTRSVQRLSPTPPLPTGAAGHRCRRTRWSCAAPLGKEDSAFRQPPRRMLLSSLERGIRDLNAAVIEPGRADPALRGMGSTLTAARSVGRVLQIAHVGDSRAYLRRDGRLHRLTRDHTYVQMLVDTKEISPRLLSRRLEQLVRLEQWPPRGASALSRSGREWPSSTGRCGGRTRGAG